MIIGHLPAGYVMSKLLFRRFDLQPTAYLPFLWAGALGAIAPDFDMFYFHLVDHRQHHHHTYFTHFPIFWGLLLAAAAVWLYFGRNKSWPACAFIFSLGGFIHMVLDSIVGDVWWLAPFVDKSYSLFGLQRYYEPWWLNFILHWSFALELVIVTWAIFLWRRAADDGRRKIVAGWGQSG